MTARPKPGHARRRSSRRTAYPAEVGELLFNNGHLSAALEAQARKMREAVAAEPEASLAQADAEAWAEALAHHFGAACPVLKTDEIWQEPPADTTVDEAARLRLWGDIPRKIGAKEPPARARYRVY